MTRACLAILVLFSLAVLAACPTPPQDLADKPGLVRLQPESVPDFSDDLDPESLQASLRGSLEFFSKLSPDQKMNLGEMPVPAEKLKHTILEFIRLLHSGELNSTSIRKSFDVYLARADRPDGQGMVTGYYEPVLEGRLAKDADFKYPLYRVPGDLLTIDLNLFDPARFQGEKLTGRLEGKKIVPYYTRAEIDRDRRLEGSGYELVWVKDPIDLFFLHVQGSGLIKLRDGTKMRVGYAAANGRPYRSTGKYLIENGLMSSDGMSMQTIRGYLRENPAKIWEALWYNESYVFFRQVGDGPVGSINVKLTGGRSIATDPRYHPRGALAFLETQRPTLDALGKVTGQQPLRRWVMNQDAGGAIKGVGRVDLFCGTGEDAEQIAGRMKNAGNLYFFLKKE